MRIKGFLVQGARSTVKKGTFDILKAADFWVRVENTCEAED